MPDQHKTLEQRVAEIELNLKKLREEITNAYISWEGKIVLEQSPTQTPDQPKQPPAQIGRTKTSSVSPETSIPTQCRTGLKSWTPALLWTSSTLNSVIRNSHRRSAFSKMQRYLLMIAAEGRLMSGRPKPTTI